MLAISLVACKMGTVDSIILKIQFILFLSVHDHSEAHWRVESESPSLEEEIVETGPVFTLLVSI